MRGTERGDTLAARLFSAKSGGSFDDSSRRLVGADGDDPTITDHKRGSASEGRQIRLDGRGAPDFRVGAISDANRAGANGPGRAERAPSTAELAGSPLQCRQ